METQYQVAEKSELQNHKDEVVDVDIGLLKFDANNPNIFTKKQMKSLQDVIQKFGYLVPIIIDIEGNIIDGEHRAVAYKQLGYHSIPSVIISNYREVDKKFLRQWMNKFKGQHDIEKDVAEMSFILEDEVGAAMMENYLDVTDDTLTELAKSMDSTEGEVIDQTTTDNNDYPTESHKKIILYFTKSEYKDYKEIFDRLKKEYKVTDEVQVVKKLIEEHDSGI